MLGQLRSASVVAAVQNGVQCTASFPNPRFFGMISQLWGKNIFGVDIQYCTIPTDRSRTLLLWQVASWSQPQRRPESPAVRRITDALINYISVKTLAGPIVMKMVVRRGGKVTHRHGRIRNHRDKKVMLCNDPDRNLISSVGYFRKLSPRVQLINPQWRSPSTIYRQPTQAAHGLPIHSRQGKNSNS